MHRNFPWLLTAMLAAGCAGAPGSTPALTLGADGPTYTIQKTWVIPHVLEKSGSLSARDLDEAGVKYRLLSRDGEFHRIQAFTLHLRGGAPDSDGDFVYPPGQLQLELAPEALKALIDLDDDGRVDKTAPASRLVLELTHPDRRVTELQFFCPHPTGAQRTVGAGTVSDIIEFAGMAINEQGIPSKKAKKAAKKAK